MSTDPPSDETSRGNGTVMMPQMAQHKQTPDVNIVMPPLPAHRRRLFVVIHILRRIQIGQHIFPTTQEKFKNVHYDCILDLLRITMTVSILHDLI